MTHVMQQSHDEPRWMTGIDHPVIAIADMDAAHAAYERLGFTIPPRGSHIEWGTGNWCIMFPRDYLELRGIVKEGHTHNLDAFLQRHGEGLMGLALGTDDAEASRRQLEQRGFHPQPVRGLTRNFELPEGWVQPRFSLCFLNEEETGGLMSVVFCQHLTPDLIRRPEWLRHANAACGVRGLVGVVDNIEQAAATQRALFAGNVTASGERVLVDTGRGTIDLRTVDALRRQFPECASLTADNGPRLAVVVLESADLRQTAETLRSRGVAYRQTPESTLVVPPHEARGVALEFVEVADPPLSSAIPNA